MWRGPLDGIRRGILNLFAVALWHGFDQQVMVFHRNEVLQPSEEDNPTHFKLKVFQERLARHGIDIRKLPSWSRLHELELVANTVKHAEGPSARALQSLRPDLFIHPLSVSLGASFFAPTIRRVFQPVIGEDLYVSIGDLRSYRDSLIEFWRQLLDAMAVASDNDTMASP